MSEWMPIGTAPKDGTHIVAWCNHAADPYHLDDRHLTTYGAHVEGLSHVDDGPCVVVWGGAIELGDDEGGGYIPDWWFRVGSEFEEAANPTHWMPLPPPPKDIQG